MEARRIEGSHAEDHRGEDLVGRRGRAAAGHLVSPARSRCVRSEAHMLCLFAPLQDGTRRRTHHDLPDLNLRSRRVCRARVPARRRPVRPPSVRLSLPSLFFADTPRIYPFSTAPSASSYNPPISRSNCSPSSPHPTKSTSHPALQASSRVSPTLARPRLRSSPPRRRGGAVSTARRPGNRIEIREPTC